MNLTSHNSVGILSFDPGSPYPVLSHEVQDELESLLRGVERDRPFRGIVLASNAQSFATGAAIDEIAPLRGFAAREFARRGQRLMNLLRRFPVPVVAAIRGFCLGGGLDLALSCHARVAAYDASFGHPGGALGLMTGWGGTQRLPRLLGRLSGAQLLVTGEKIPATQALTMGLVDELTDAAGLMDCAARRAQHMADQKDRLAPISA